MQLSPLDWLVVLIPLCAVFATAMTMSRKMKGVAGFLAADRCAGRYLISTASTELTASVMVLLVGLEVFSRTGFSLRFWVSFSDTALLILGLLGVVVYRFRQTRSLTFHQFFERRYSKGVRVFSSFLHVFSGLINFGVQPAVGARFFVYFCGMPDKLHIGGSAVPTFAVVMLVLMGVSMFFALSGGQISIMVTDCLEGVISSFLYVVIGVFVIATISVSQMYHALSSGTSGNSYLDPFDVGSRTDFNGWYVLIGLLLWTYQFRGTAWTQGFAASAKSAHESRMAGILGSWRAYCGTAMSVLIALAAFTVLHHPDFVDKQHVVDAALIKVDSEQLRTQMRMPTALGTLFVPGIKGALCAVLLFGIVASQGAQLHGYGSTILQDVILPLRRKHFSPKGHLRALKMTIGMVGVFVCVFSYFFKPVDYLVMLTALIGAIYLGGIGAVVWGGLYWRRGTTAGAWSALILGSGLGVGFNLVTQLWSTVTPSVARLFGPGSVADWLHIHGEKCPVNGLILSLITAGVSASSYIVVSLLNRRPAFDLDSLLHHDESPTPIASRSLSRLDRLLNIDNQFTRSDRALTKFTFGWTIMLKVFSIGVLLWVAFVGRPSVRFWFDYTMITGVWITVAIAIVVTIWFTIGVSRDLMTLFRSLSNVRRATSDDGTEQSAAPVHELPQPEADAEPTKTPLAVTNP